MNALMIEAVRTFETSVNFYQTTRSNNPEDSRFHCYISLGLTSEDFYLYFTFCGRLIFLLVRKKKPERRKLINVLTLNIICDVIRFFFQDKSGRNTRHYSNKHVVLIKAPGAQLDCFINIFKRE
jgi:hypothetical protein